MAEFSLMCPGGLQWANDTGKEYLGRPTILGGVSTSTKKQRKIKKTKRLNRQKGRNR